MQRSRIHIAALSTLLLCGWATSASALTYNIQHNATGDQCDPVTSSGANAKDVYIANTSTSASLSVSCPMRAHTGTTNIADSVAVTAKVYNGHATTAMTCQTMKWVPNASEPTYGTVVSVAGSASPVVKEITMPAITSFDMRGSVALKCTLPPNSGKQSKIYHFRTVTTYQQ